MSPNVFYAWLGFSISSAPSHSEFGCLAGCTQFQSDDAFYKALYAEIACRVALLGPEYGLLHDWVHKLRLYTLPQGTPLKVVIEFCEYFYSNLSLARRYFATPTPRCKDVSTDNRRVTARTMDLKKNLRSSKRAVGSPIRYISDVSSPDSFSRRSAGSTK
jgi:hypothetical protein